MWEPLDLMMIRDAALTDKVPRLSRVEFEPLSGRLVYNMGHACFEFIESRYGKEGIRQFLYTLRKGLLGGGPEELYKQAFRTTPEEFDAAFDKWLKERFKPFRDRQRPDDFGRDLSPNPEKTRLHAGLRLLAEPFRRDRRGGHREPLRRRGRRGADLHEGRQRDPEPHERLRQGLGGARLQQRVHLRALARLRPERRQRRLLRPHRQGPQLLPDLGARRQGKKKVHVPLDETQAPCLLADGKTVLFAALKDGHLGHLLARHGDGRRPEPDQGRLRRQRPADLAGRQAGGLRAARERQQQALRLPAQRPSHKTQLTFGPFDDTAPIFSSDGHRLYYASDEDDDIPNLRSLDLRTGAIQQYTDVFGGTMAPAPLKTPRGDRLAFITYYKGEWKLHTKDTADPIKEVDQEVQAAAEGLVDFQPDVPHEVVPENKRRKKIFEGLYLEGRPPINVGVTSSGNFYGGTSIALTDVLGDQLFTFTVLSVSSYRIYDGRYTNLASRMHYGINFYDQTYFFYPYYSYYPATTARTRATSRSRPSASRAARSSPSTRSTPSAASSSGSASRRSRSSTATRTSSS
jgi:hypothetical protein